MSIAAFSVGLSLTCLSQAHAALNQSDLKPAGNNAYQSITGDDSDDDRGQWDQLYQAKEYVYGTEPAKFLTEAVEFLPRGRAMDIAMGEGRNAVFLAKKGFVVEGVDYSEEALRKAKKLASNHHVVVHTINADLNQYRFKEATYDVMLNIDYLQRSLVPQIKRGLKKGGVVVFETATIDQLKNVKGQAIPVDFLLKPGELKQLFRDFEILVYRETNDGKMAKASMIARKVRD